MSTPSPLLLREVHVGYLAWSAEGIVEVSTLVKLSRIEYQDGFISTAAIRGVLEVAHGRVPMCNGSERQLKISE